MAEEVAVTNSDPNALPVSEPTGVSEFDGGLREGATTSIDDLIGGLDDDDAVEDEDDDFGGADDIIEDLDEDEDEDDDDVYDDDDEEEDLDDEDLEDDEEEEDTTPDPEQFLKYKVKAKVNGEEIDVSVQELVDNYQLGQSAREKFSQAAQMRKQSEEFINLLRSPQTVWNVLEQLGHDVETMAEEYIVERIKYHQMPEGDRRAMEAEKKYEALMRKQQESERAQQQAQLDAQAKQYEGQLTEDINGALESIGLVNNKRTFAKVATIMAQALQNDMRLSATQAARLAKKEIQEEVSGLLADSDQETLERLVGSKEKVKATKARGKKVLRKKRPTDRNVPIVEKVAKKKRITREDPNAFNELFKSL